MEFIAIKPSLVTEDVEKNNPLREAISYSTFEGFQIILRANPALAKINETDLMSAAIYRAHADSNRYEGTGGQMVSTLIAQGAKNIPKVIFSEGWAATLGASIADAGLAQEIRLQTETRKRSMALTIG